MKKAICVLLFLLAFSPLFAQNKCNCEVEFKWMKETFEKNDAGFAYGIQQKGQDAYEKHNAAILKKIKNAKDKNECVDILSEWVTFFRKAHFYVSAINNSTPAASSHPSAWPTVAVSEKGIKDQVQPTNIPAYEGIWATGNYTIGVIKDTTGYKGIILSPSGNQWKPNQVKFEIAKSGSGTYYMGDYSAVKFDKTMLIGKNTLKLGSIYLFRKYPVLAESDTIALYTREITASTPFIQEISKETVLFRIPSFDDGQKNAIDSLINANKTLLASKKNLIIDIRNNGGGSDGSYNQIIPYLYTNPIRITALELLSTPLNNKRMEGYLSLPNLSEKNKNDVHKALDTLNKHIGQFVNLNGSPVFIQKLDSVLPKPQNVAVIINQNNGSTAEQFILAAKQSRKVKLFGVTTMGVLDISNMYAVDSPDKQIRLGYCLSKSLRINGMKIDNIGLQPDYYLDSSIPDELWLTYVTQTLEQ